MDSRILGIDMRYNVSWIARQSSSETRTAELRYPTIMNRIIVLCDIIDRGIDPFPCLF